MPVLRCCFVLWLVLLLSQAGHATEPPGYYASAQGLSGPQLRAALHAIIKNATTLCATRETTASPTWRSPTT